MGMDRRLAHTRRATAGAALLLLALACGKAAAGTWLHAEILLADALHSGTDLLALAAVWFGITLASRERTRRFPFGFYRAETLAALTAALVILYLGVEIAIDGIRQWGQVPKIEQSGLAMTVAGLSAVASYMLSRWERHIGESGHSQSLAAVADESLMDVYSSCLVLVSIAVASLGISWLLPLATVFISGVVLWAGLKHATLAALSLMDASVDPGLEQAVMSTLETIPGIRRVAAIRMRRSGPFYFVDGQVEVSGSMDVNRSHALIHRAQDAVFEKHPRVEGVILHVEPHHGDRRRVLMPVRSVSGLEAEAERHFGRAPWYLLATIRDGEIKAERTMANPFKAREVQAGLAVINKLARQYEIDAVAALEIGEIAFHALHENGVQVYEAMPGTARGTLTALVEKRLPILTGPTHSSETGEWREKKATEKI